MTITELRAHPDYMASMDKIKAYRPGFTFRMDWTQIPTAKGNALKIVLGDAIDAGYLVSVSLEPDMDIGVAAATYRRTDKPALMPR